MSSQRSKEFLDRFRARQTEATGLRTVIEETGRRLSAARTRQDTLLEDIDQRIRRMPPVEVLPMGEGEAPTPNEINLAVRMETVRQLREQRMAERKERQEARERARVRTEERKVDTTDAFIPKRKLDMD